MFGKCAKNVNVIVTALDSQIRRKALKVGLRGPDTNSALCGWHGCFLTSKWTSDVSMYCFSFLFQNFWSFSGIFYGSGPLWESAIKVCDVASELLEVSVTQAHVPCTTPQLSLASSPVLPHVGLYPAVEGRPLPHQPCSSFCSLCLGELFEGSLLMLKGEGPLMGSLHACPAFHAATPGGGVVPALPDNSAV